MAFSLRRRDVVDLLEGQHDEVREVFAHLLATNDEKAQAALLRELDEGLEILAKVEEEVFYHEFKIATLNNQQRRAYVQTREQHEAMRLLLNELRTCEPGTDTFWAKLKVLEGLLHQHAEHEKRSAFVSARSILPSERLFEMAKELRKRRMELKSEKRGVGEEKPAARAGMFLPR